MVSIQHISIKNFQIHEHLELDFHENFTGIIGPSDSGKTAVMRAMYWCLFNEPSGTSFIKRGTTTAVVTVTFSNGLKITRTKGSKNAYDIMYPNGEEVHLEGFGAGPNDDVIRAHGMLPVDLFEDKQVLNYCEQLSTPFFLGETPTKKGVIIGKLAKAEMVDLAIKNTSADLRAEKAKLKEYKAELKDVKSELKEIKGLPSMEKAIEYAERRAEKVQYLESKIKNIQGICENLGSLQEKKTGLQSIIEDKTDIESAALLIDQAIEINNKVVELRKYLDALNTQKHKLSVLRESIVDEVEIQNIIATIDSAISITENIGDIKSVISNIKNSETTKEELKRLPSKELVDEIINDIDKSVEILDSLSRIKSVNSKLVESKARKTKGTEVISNLKQEHQSAIKQYEEALKSEGKCPVCMSNIDADRVEEVKKYI